MSIMEMWKSSVLRTAVLIVLNLAMMSAGRLAWVVLGLILLLGGIYLAYRQGTYFGHEACALLDNVRRVESNSEHPGQQFDKKVLSRTWSKGRGIAGVLASALVPYLASCIYLAAAILNIRPLEMPSRLVALVLAMPFWPVLAYWFESFDQLHPAIVAVLMLSPFVLPLSIFAGYMQGPRLWARSEKAMAQGLRRAKAKSRVAKKRPPKAAKPEI